MRARLFFIAAALAALPATAVPQSNRERTMRFQALDTNRDGVIARSEWRGSDESFRVHDWNGDGVLSGDEVRVGARRQGRGAPDFRSEDEFDDWTPRGFTSLDHNRDGRISRDEWHFNQEGFFRADHNRDGILNRSEFLGESVEDDRDDRFEYLDVDGNGRIERDEWHATRREFDRLDDNNDGVLQRAELVGESSTPATESFASLDVNRNGAISYNEWHWSKESFNQRDTNRDGAISRNEFGTAGAVGTSGRSQTVVVPAAERWTDSGLTVRRGDVVYLEASGTVTLSGDGRDQTDAATPAGSRTGRRAPDAPLPQQSAGGLLVRIGDAEPIFLGATSGTVRAPTNGRIYFGVNDDHLGDNHGEFRVNVRVQRGNQ
jgi:Ca2+-binding EF-hand superfamily protein